VNPDERAIKDLINRWHAATAAGDVDAVGALMSEDAVFLSAGVPPMVGRPAFETGLRELLKSHRVTSTFEVEEVYATRDLAYARTRLRVTIEPASGGSQNSRDGYALSVLRKQTDGRWLLTRDANLLGNPQENGT